MNMPRTTDAADTLSARRPAPCAEEPCQDAPLALVPPALTILLVEDDGEADDRAVADGEVAGHDQLAGEVGLVVGAVGDHRCGALEGTGEDIHAANVAVQQVRRVERLAAYLGVKIEAAIAEAAIAAGCAFYAGYPITPQNETIVFLTPRIVEGDKTFLLEKDMPKPVEGIRE